ncbi:MAG: hypothetical protein OEY79_02620 [Anaplasmataceae bacterium]|nr:hypothetical protein [Anaplasmataceae bacterium]
MNTVDLTERPIGYNDEASKRAQTLIIEKARTLIKEFTDGACNPKELIKNYAYNPKELYKEFEDIWSKVTPDKQDEFLAYIDFFKCAEADPMDKLGLMLFFIRAFVKTKYQPFSFNQIELQSQSTNPRPVKRLQSARRAKKVYSPKIITKSGIGKRRPTGCFDVSKVIAEMTPYPVLNKKAPQVRCAKVMTI